MKIRPILGILLMSTFVLFQSCSGKSNTTSQSKDWDKNESKQVSDSSDIIDIPVINTPTSEKDTRPITDDNLIELQRSIERCIVMQDSSLLESWLDSNIVTSHGGAEYGIEMFWSHWKDQNLWEVLDDLFRMTGYLETDSSYRYPYFAAPENTPGIYMDDGLQGDCFNTFFTIRDTVMIYSDTTNYKVIAKCTDVYLFDTMKFSFLNRWGEVYVNDQITGYALRSDLYRTGDYNLGLKRKEDGSWCISGLFPCD